MIIWSETASNQLLHLDECFSERNPDAAADVVYRIYLAVRSLEDFPEIGRPGSKAGARELVISRTPYLAMYRIKKGQIHILALLHSAQKWPTRLSA